MANGSGRPLETALCALILGVRGGVTISGLHSRTASPVQAASSMDHTFECSLPGSDHQPANHRFPCGHLGRQSQSLRSVTRFTDCCLTYQWNHPQAHDPNFRWQFFWDVVWKGMLGYIVLAEMWLAIESYFGLGAVAVRPPPSSGASGKNLPPPRP